MALIGSLAVVRAQLRGWPEFAAVQSYLDALGEPDSDVRQRLARVPEGETQRVELAGGAFALEQAYRSKPRSAGFFESHARFIDVQIVVAGEEVMEVADRSLLAVDRPLDPERDLITYQDTTRASVLRLGANAAAVFFPDDVHMPGLCGSSGPALVRKTVLKVPVASVHHVG